MLASLLYLVLRRLLTLVAPNHRSDDAAQIEILVLRHQLGILRRQVKRPIYRRRDRALLAAASRILPRERWGVFLVRPETLLRWHRSLVARKWTKPHRRPGRPAIDPEVCKLILSMARENPRWGYLRIKGELGKLGIRVSATSIAMLLRRAGVGPAPRRGIGWRGFLKAQAAGILACDFFTVETAFLQTLYVLFFIEIGTRRVHVTVSTTNPDSSFVTQQARNLVMSLADEGAQIRFLIRDRDAKFPSSFDEVFASEGIRSDPHANQGTECERLRRALGRDPSNRVPGLAADPGAPPSRSHPSDLCPALQSATPASRSGAWGTGEHCARRRGRRCARHRTAGSPRGARPRVREGRMIEFSYPTGSDRGQDREDRLGKVLLDEDRVAGQSLSRRVRRRGRLLRLRREDQL
jgi:putative transposase